MNEVFWEKAFENFITLGENPYPGRGIVAGTDGTGMNLVQVYWIMGRSESSRNRKLAKDEKIGQLWTEVAFPEKLKEGTDMSLLIYNAMREDCGFYAVSNGKQTDDIIDAYSRPSINANEAFRKGLSDYGFEPDWPHCTPRISSFFYLAPGPKPMIRSEMSILRRKYPDSEEVERAFFSFPNLIPGVGFCIHTYDGPGDPLPSFNEEPYPVLLEGDIKTITERFWEALDPHNIVSLATKFIDTKTGQSKIVIVNKY